MQDALIQKEFALKKIRCLTGAEGVEVAMREVAAYRRFKCVLCALLFVYHLRTRDSGTLTSSDYM
jgi:4-aminobutyrate aminotransferase-like enzyme